MRILAIETSCDETAISIVDANGQNLTVLGNALISQADLHKEFGGVFPNLARREHERNLVPLLLLALKQAGLYEEGSIPFSKETLDEVKQILAREHELFSHFLVGLARLKRPQIDAIAVTSGPGLEPALWVGINFAKALAKMWGLGVIPVNHMEGHIISSLMQKSEENSYILPTPNFPVLSLLISGGHTELVAMNEWGKYELVGSTLDDAVGEAFDKVARMMDLPYPGGPQISKLASTARDSGRVSSIKLPRPMISSGTCDFSFAGLKTAVLYALRKIDTLSPELKEEIALEFETAVTEVLLKKTMQAIKQTSAQTLLIGGGVSANAHIRKVFKEEIPKVFPDLTLAIPERELTTDNALMIAGAAYLRAQKGNLPDPLSIRADGNLSLSRG